MELTTKVVGNERQLELVRTYPNLAEALIRIDFGYINLFPSEVRHLRATEVLVPLPLEGDYQESTTRVFDSLRVRGLVR